MRSEEGMKKIIMKINNKEMRKSRIRFFRSKRSRGRNSVTLTDRFAVITLKYRYLNVCEQQKKTIEGGARERERERERQDLRSRRFRISKIFPSSLYDEKDEGNILWWDECETEKKNNSDFRLKNKDGKK